jgi:hypothetical protein
MQSRRIEQEKFGFLAQMWRMQEPLFLFKGGHWGLKSLKQWSTDIDVVSEAHALGLLEKVAVTQRDCLEARDLTEKGREFSKALYARMEDKENAERRKRAVGRQWKNENRLRQSAAKSFGPAAIPLGHSTGIWIAHDRYVAFGVQRITNGGALLLKCNFCSEVWSPISGSGGEYFHCPSGCNRALTIQWSQCCASK